MFFFFGHRLYGKVDQVPGVFYVGTLFLHLFFVPLIPFKTMLVIDRPYGNTIRGCPIGLSLRSILAAWLRLVLGAALLIGMLVLLIGAFVWVTEGKLQHPEVLGNAGAVVALIAVLYWGSYWVSRPTYRRARKLAKLLAIDPDQVEHYIRTGENRPEVSSIGKSAAHAQEWSGIVLPG